jgi:hypothetical protein
MPSTSQKPGAPFLAHFARGGDSTTLNCPRHCSCGTDTPCPLPLTLILILMWSGRRVPHFSRTLREVGFHNSQPNGISIPAENAPQAQRWKSGTSAPRNAHTIRNRASALVDFGCKHFLIARPAGKRKARPGKPPHALAPKAPLTSNACAPCAIPKSTSPTSPSSANRSGPQPSSPCRNQRTA